MNTFKRYHSDGGLPSSSGMNWVWVFGSNLSGRHSAGEALVAKNTFGALYGRGYGFHGRSYAIPTKDNQLSVLPLADIERYIHEFISFAWDNADRSFYVTRIGCGLAGYKDSQMGPMFAKTPGNCSLPAEWRMFDSLSNTSKAQEHAHTRNRP